MSCLLFFWLFYVLGNLLKNASRLVGRLTLLKESNELKRVSGHCLVRICKLKLMSFGLRKEDLFIPSIPATTMMMTPIAARLPLPQLAALALALLPSLALAALTALAALAALVTLTLALMPSSALAHCHQ